MNCETIPGEVVVSQHRLVLVDLKTIPKMESRYRRANKDRIKRWRLTGQAVVDNYAKDVINGGGG